MVLWWAMVALAAPPAADKGKAADPKGPVVIEVVPTMVEGRVKLTLAGHEGHQLYVDGWLAGTLPVETTLAEGPHRFRIQRDKDVLEEIEAYVIPLLDKVLEIDLAKPPKPPEREPPPE